MRLSIPTIAATLFATLAVPTLGLPANCLPCAPLCAYNKEWCSEAKCFTEMLGGRMITAICGLGDGRWEVKGLQPFTKLKTVKPAAIETMIA